MVIRRLRTLASPTVALRGRTFFKRGARVALYGVKAPDVRRVVRSLQREIGGRWSLGEAIACCDVLIRKPHLEAKVAGVLLLGRYHREFERPFVEVVHSWIARGWCANWAIVDAVCPTLLTPLLLRYPALAPRVARWRTSGNPWLRRAAVVTFVPLARRGEHLDLVYQTVGALLGDPEDLMHKACGWLLREAGKTDMSRLERFLLRNGPEMQRVTVRYAIERFPARRRKALLERTRGG